MKVLYFYNTADTAKMYFIPIYVFFRIEEKRILFPIYNIIKTKTA